MNKIKVANKARVYIMFARLYELYGTGVTNWVYP